jgi:hypothetical protein
MAEQTDLYETKTVADVLAELKVQVDVGLDGRKLMGLMKCPKKSNLCCLFF